MSVELKPEELGFRRPFDHEVTQILSISNPNASTVAFKVKTTAPKQYCVRPNSGIVKANSTVDVQVLLQAMKEQPDPDAKCRDKFLVQSVVMADHEDDADIPSLWSAIEKTNKASIQERKIKVHFLPAGGPQQTNGLSASHDEPPAYSSPASAYNSPAPGVHSAVTEKSPTPAESARSTVAHAAEVTGVAGAAAAVANAMPSNQAELQQQLNVAQAKIKELTNQLSDPAFRQRKVAEAQEKVQTVVQQSQETGVPLHITAGLCLLSFIIAWLFF